MKRVLLLLAACGDTDPLTSPIDAPRIMPTVDAPATPAVLTARVYAAPPTVEVYETAHVLVDVTNLGGTAIDQVLWSDDASAVASGCEQGPLIGGALCELDFPIVLDHAGVTDVSIDVHSTAGDSVKLHVPVTAVAPSSLGADPRAIAFGRVALPGPFGGGTSQIITLRNNTASQLGPVAFSIAGDLDLTVSDFDSCMGASLQPSQLCRIQVFANPTTSSPLHATVSVTAGAEHVDIPVSATGTALLIAPGFTTDHVVVPDAYASTSGGSRHLAVTNVTTDSVGPLAVSITHADGTQANEFQLFGQNCVGAQLPGAHQCDLFIGLASLDAGMKTATLKISSGTTSESIALVGYVVDRN